MSDLISRDKAVAAVLGTSIEYQLIYGKKEPKEGFVRSLIKSLANIPQEETERLTDDDFETIRIHLNACKEKLCNQRRWKEAYEYQRIIDRFMAFASAETEIIRCRDCKFLRFTGTVWKCQNRLVMMLCEPDDYCSRAERKEE